MSPRFPVAPVATLRQQEQEATTNLMEEAGQKLYAFLKERVPHASHWLVHLGRGNNAGDARVAMRHAQQAGIQCTAVTLDGQEGALKATDPWPEADVVIDALFGLGLDRPLSPEWSAWIERINHSTAPVCSVDLPSGLHADTGHPMPVAVRATWTTTFMACTPGLATGWGRGQAGEVIPIPLKVPPIASPEAWWHDTFQPPPQRPGDAHKKQCGHVLVVGGAPGHTGATLLAGHAALRAGAGLVSVLLPHEPAGMVGHLPELMIHSASQANENALWEQADVIVIGPGLEPQDPWSQQQVARALKHTQPVLWDAGALHLLAQQPPHTTLHNAVLTPHPGEASVLLGSTPIPRHADRFAMLDALYQRYRVPVLLKGAGSLVQGPQATTVCGQGHAGMATAGMGDVLSGVVAALWAQGLEAEEALRQGVLLHAQAAQHAAHKAPIGLMASDLMSWIQQCRNTP